MGLTPNSTSPQSPLANVRAMSMPRHTRRKSLPPDFSLQGAAKKTPLSRTRSTVVLSNHPSRSPARPPTSPVSPGAGIRTVSSVYSRPKQTPHTARSSRTSAFSSPQTPVRRPTFGQTTPVRTPAQERRTSPKRAKPLRLSLSPPPLLPPAARVPARVSRASATSIYSRPVKAPRALAHVSPPKPKRLRSPPKRAPTRAAEEDDAEMGLTGTSEGSSNLVCSAGFLSSQQTEDGERFSDELALGRGDVLAGRYDVVSRLGGGMYATVWLCWDAVATNAPKAATDRFVAVKVHRCTDEAAAAAQDEAAILADLAGAMDAAVPVQRLLGAFDEVRGGRVAKCLVLPVLGGDLLQLRDAGHALHTRLCKCVGREGGSEAASAEYSRHLAEVKVVVRDILRGLAALCDLGVCHADLKPENVLMTALPQALRQAMRDYQLQLQPEAAWGPGELVDAAPPADPAAPAVRISDFGLAFNLSGADGATPQQPLALLRPGWAAYPGAPFQTLEYRAPEVILGAPFSYGVDVWSTGCMAWELATGGYLIDPKAVCPPGAGDQLIDEAHVFAIQRTLGLHDNDQGGVRADAFYHANGAYRDLDMLVRSGGVQRRQYEAELTSAGLMDAEGAAAFASFLAFCLGSANAARRPTAREVLAHPWLQPPGLCSP